MTVLFFDRRAPAPGQKPGASGFLSSNSSGSGDILIAAAFRGNANRSTSLHGNAMTGSDGAFAVESKCFPQANLKTVPATATERTDDEGVVAPSPLTTSLHGNAKNRAQGGEVFNFTTQKSTKNKLKKWRSHNLRLPSVRVPAGPTPRSLLPTP